MIKIQAQPPSIHSVHGPVIFEFSNVIENQFDGEVTLEANNRTLKVPLEFYNQYSRVDLRIYLRHFFGSPGGVSEGVLCEDYQSFSYRIKLSDKRSTEEFTAVRAIPQLGENNDWSTRAERFLTGFHQLKVYEGYPCDLSILAGGKKGLAGSAGKWRGFDLQPEKVNRLALSNRPEGGCTDEMVEVQPYLSCSLEWDYVCGIAEGKPTDYGFGKELLYRTLKNQREISRTQYSVLDAFGAYPVTTKEAYERLEPTQAAERANALLEQVKNEVCQQLEIINETINSNFNLCTGEEADEMIGQVIDYAGKLNGWDDKWLLCNGAEYEVEDYEPLYKAIGNVYGGNGGKFKVPNLGGLFIVGYQEASSQTPEDARGIYKLNYGKIGNIGGSNQHTLKPEEMPKHEHDLRASDNGNGGNAFEKGSHGGSLRSESAGGGLPHENRPPYMVFAKLIRAK